jgi:hypothetical protein
MRIFRPSSQSSELEQEILKDPPLRCSISFHWNGTQDDTDRVHFYLVLQSPLLRRKSPATPWQEGNRVASISASDYESAQNKGL